MKRSASTLAAIAAWTLFLCAAYRVLPLIFRLAN